MPMQPHDQKHIDDFLVSLEPLGASLDTASFNFVAIKADGRFVIAQARVFLLNTPPLVPFAFASETLRAESHRLSDIKLSPHDLIDALLKGSVTVQGTQYEFPPDQHGRHSPFHMAFHQEGLTEQRRLATLSLRGADVPPVDLNALDWELRAGDSPYAGLGEILGHLRLPPVTPGPILVDFVRPNVAQIDTAKSRVKGTKAYVEVALAPGLDRRQFRIGYRVQDKDRAVHSRGTLAGDQLTWSSNGAHDRVLAEFDVPSAAVVNATATYAGIAQHHWWFGDPDTSQNPRRAVYTAFDPDLAIVRDAILKAQGKNPEARTFEAAVGWVLWMLGFSPANVGKLTKMSEVPDHLAVTPSGSFLVVEVTAGLLKAENKLAILVDRFENVRQALGSADHAHAKVLPMIVTSKTRAEVAVDLEQAQRLGVYVVAREDFEDILTQTLLPPNADQVFARIEASIAAASEQLPKVLL